MAGYGTDELFTAWLASNGYELPETAPAPAVLRHKGSSYLDGLYNAPIDPKLPRFPGFPTDPLVQERAWPRTGAEAYGVAIPTNTVPAAIITASYFAAWHEANNQGSLNTAGSMSAMVRREKVDVIETEYFVGSGNVVADQTVRIAAVEGLVAPFLTRPEIGAIYTV